MPPVERAEPSVLVSLWSALTTRRYLARSWTLALASTAVIVFGAGGLAITAGHFGVPLLVTLTVLGIMSLLYTALAMTSLDRALAAFLRPDGRRLFAFGGFLMALHLIYGVATGTLNALSGFKLLAFVFIPTLLILWAGKRAHPTWQDAVAVFCLWIPFDAGWLKGVWLWPEGEGAYILNTVYAVVLAVVLFVCYRGLSGIGFRLRASRRDLLLGALAFLLFAALAIPAGFATGFIALKPNLTLANLLGAPLGIFFFIAIPEELLFRGLTQNFLARALKHEGWALVIASVLFGLTHLNNGPAPDWRYGVLATVAGLFYGELYRRTRSLLVPALVHAAVDTVWIWFFYNGIR